MGRRRPTLRARDVRRISSVPDSTGALSRTVGRSRRRQGPRGDARRRTRAIRRPRLPAAQHDRAVGPHDRPVLRPARRLRGASRGTSGAPAPVFGARSRANLSASAQQHELAGDSQSSPPVPRRHARSRFAQRLTAATVSIERNSSTSVGGSSEMASMRMIRPTISAARTFAPSSTRSSRGYQYRSSRRTKTGSG